MLIHLSTGQQFQCPLDENFHPINGTFPDPNYCNVYYHCIGGVAYPEQCPIGLVFTVKLKSCKYTICVNPADANCPENSRLFNNIKQNEPTPFKKSQLTQNLEEKQSVNGFRCDPTIDGTFPNPRDCREYYHCVKGRAWPNQCPSDYAFNPTFNIRDCNVKVCIPQKEAKCPVNGGWSQWSAFEECSPDCGNGVKARFRECNSPTPANGGLQCEGDSVDVINCNAGDCASNSLAFYVSNRRAQRLFGTKHVFNKVYMNSRNIFNPTTSTVVVEENGYYWFTFIATGQKYRGRENDATISTGFERDLPGWGGVTNEVNSIMYRKQELQLYRYIFNQPYIYGSEDGAETSWLGYKIDSNDLFFGQSNRNANPGAVFFQFRRISRNIYGSSELSVTSGGYYYIAFSFKHKRPTTLTMRVNRQSIDEMWMNFDISGFYHHDITSKSLIVKLNPRDKFEMYVQNGSIISDRDRLISLSVYRLNRISDIITVVRNTNFSSSSFERLSFDYELHNVGNSWNSTVDEFICRRAGTYKISLSLGIKNNFQTFAEILVNNKVKARLYATQYRPLRSHMISRTSLFNLLKGDKISIRIRGALDVTVTKPVLNIFQI